MFTPQEVTGRPWLKEFAQAPATLVCDTYVRVYFSCRPPPDQNGQYVSYSAWVDLDRADLRRVLRVSAQPILPLGGLGEFDEFGTYPVSVIADGQQLRAYYAGWTRCESVPFNVAIGMATSSDGGATFVKAGTGPVLSYTPDEPFLLSGPKIRRFDGGRVGSTVANGHHLEGIPRPLLRAGTAVSRPMRQHLSVVRSRPATRCGAIRTSHNRGTRVQFLTATFRSKPMNSNILAIPLFPAQCGGVS